MASSPLNRPSVSPLSDHRGSVLDVASDPPAQQEDEDHDLADDRSSSLSEPEDDDDEGDFPTDAVPPSVYAAHASLDIDSEAETERLDQTPQKARHQAQQSKTPSKLAHASTVDDDDALDDLSEPPSPIPTVPGGASSTSTIDNAGASRKTGAVPCDADSLDAGKKRKRSDSADSSLSSPQSDDEESPRKRSNSSVENDTAIENEPAAIATIEDIVDEVLPTLEHADVPVAADPPKTGKKKGGRPKGKGKKEAVKEPEPDTTERLGTDEERGEEADAKSKEDYVRKQPASTAFDDIAKQFASYRRKAQNDRLAEIDAELAMLSATGDCKHPEYLRQIACVDARYAKQVDETRAFRKFKTESIRRTTLGERSQLHSQYYQHARELRENAMVELSEDWYGIQKERRQANQSNDELYMRKFQTNKSVQIRHQAKYNQEVSVLSGVAKYVGFPAAPDITGAEGDAMDDDLRAMKVCFQSMQVALQEMRAIRLTGKQINKRAAPTAQPVYFPNRTGYMQAPQDRIAHEQFVEQNPWARSQGPILNHGLHGTPNLLHTPDWQNGGERNSAAANNARNVIRNMGSHNPSPFATPMPQRRAPAEHSSAGTVPANSDPAEQPPSSVGPPSERAVMHFFPPRDGRIGSPLAVAKQRQNGGERELTGYRNISNISGATTIDAPDSAEKDSNAAARRDLLGGVSAEASAPLQAFDTSQLHRQPLNANGIKRNMPETYPNGSFKPPEGAFGTPALLQ